MSASYAGQDLHIKKTYSGINVPLTEKKRLNVTFAHARLQEMITLLSIEKYTPRVPLIKPLTENVKIKLKLSSYLKKVNLPKETQQPSGLKRKITHQDPVTPFRYSRPENIIDPDDNNQFLNDTEKHESQKQALTYFSQQYGEPWLDDEQLTQLYGTHMNQIKDQDIQGRHTRTYLCYLNNQRDTLINNMETVIKEIYHHQSHALKINLSFRSSYNTVKLWNTVISIPVIMNNY